MLRDYEDENGNIVLYFDDVPPDAQTRKYKIELDPNMRNDYASGKWIEEEEQATYTRNIAVREQFKKVVRPQIWKWMERGGVSRKLWKDVIDGKQNLHHYFPISLGGKNTADNIYLIEKDVHVRLHQVFLSSVNHHLRKPEYLKIHDEGRLYLELPIPETHLLDVHNLDFTYQQKDKSVLSKYPELKAEPELFLDNGTRKTPLSPLSVPAYSKRLIKGRKIKHILTKKAIDAIENGDLERFKRIIDNTLSYGLTVDMLHSEKGQTLLMIACEKCSEQSRVHPEMICYLLEKGANPQQTDSAGKVALHYIENVRPYIVEQLIKAGGCANTQDKYGRTPLFYLGSCLPWPKAKVLIQNGADINHQSKDGNTALFRAFKYQRSGMIYALIAHGIDTKIQNNQGWIAFEYVKKRLEAKRFKGRQYHLNQNKVLIKYAKECMAKKKAGLLDFGERD